MTQMMNCGDTTDIYKEIFNGLPQARKSKIFELLGTPLSVTDHRYCFAKADGGRRDNALKIMTDYYEQKESAIRRKNLEMLCEGTYTLDDIRAIFEIQQGRCYFSSEPISFEREDYSIDHLKPVCSGGSFWPGNLALVTKEINQEKHWRTKAQYCSFLEKSKGTSWVAQQKAWCADIDKARRSVDRDRRNTVSGQIHSINAEVQRHFNLYEWESSLKMESGQLLFQVDEFEISFPPGILRQKKKWADASYLISLVNTLRGK
jgi:hypothetical protein